MSHAQNPPGLSGLLTELELIGLVNVGMDENPITFLKKRCAQECHLRGMDDLEVLLQGA